MITRIVYSEEKASYNGLVRHPVQTWEWGDFKTSQGDKVYRLGLFEDKEMVGGYTVSFHRIPHTDYSVGTLWRGPAVDEDMVKNVRKIAQEEKAIYVKFEPDVVQKIYLKNGEVKTFPINDRFDNFVVSPKVNFYPFSHVVDLTKTEDQLLESMHPKTRYNIKLANRYGVQVIEKSDDEGFEIYVKLLFETTKRQGFTLYNEKYHRDLWQILKKTKMAHIMLSSYQNQVLSAFMLFTLKDRLFYPYGASLDVHREVMAQNLLMWESIKFGKTKGCKSFDMWGSLGPDAKETDQGFGFSRFKQGYGGDLVQFMGSYDLIINPSLYRIYNTLDKYRWRLLHLKARVLRR